MKIIFEDLIDREAMPIKIRPIYCFILLLFLPTLVFSTSDEEAVLLGTSKGTPPSIGNFALPPSQQPGPLISLGQTLVGRNQQQFAYNVDEPFRNQDAWWVFGISDSTAFYFDFPIAVDNGEQFNPTFSGFKKVTFQLEHALYSAGDAKHQDQATVVGALYVPLTEKVLSGLPSGFGSPAVLLGATYARTTVDWYSFISPGVRLMTADHNVRLGTEYLYQAGLGRVLLSASDKYIFMTLMELNGQYTEKAAEFGLIRPNTGGNIVTLTPSLSFETPSVIVQVGVGFPVVHHLNGVQGYADYTFSMCVQWTIN